MLMHTFDPNEQSNLPRMLIGYNNETSYFSVEFEETGCGYFVHRHDLVGDYKGFNEILRQILSGCNQLVETLLDDLAQKEIDLILYANVVLF